MIAAAAIVAVHAIRPMEFVMAGGYLFNSQFPTANAQRPTTPNAQLDVVGSRDLEIGSGWQLVVGSWEFRSHRGCAVRPPPSPPPPPLEKPEGDALPLPEPPDDDDDDPEPPLLELVDPPLPRVATAGSPSRGLTRVYP
jgi:hypothetical protein